MSLWDDYDLGASILDRAMKHPVPLDDPQVVEQLGRQARPAIEEIAEAARAMARILDACNRDHPGLIDALTRLAENRDGEL